MLKSNGPNRDPWGTSKSSSDQLLKCLYELLFSANGL